MIARLALLMDVALLPPMAFDVKGTSMLGWESETNFMSDFLSTLGWPSISESSESYTWNASE